MRRTDYITIGQLMSNCYNGYMITKNKTNISCPLFQVGSRFGKKKVPGPAGKSLDPDHHYLLFNWLIPFGFTVVPKSCVENIYIPGGRPGSQNCFMVRDTDTQFWSPVLKVIAVSLYVQKVLYSVHCQLLRMSKLTRLLGLTVIVYLRVATTPFLSHATAQVDFFLS